MMLRKLCQLSCRSLMGSMSLKRRKDALDAFKEDENVPVFLLNKQCGAVGLNLTIATHIMILECVP